MDQEIKLAILTQEGVPDAIWSDFLNHCHTPGAEDVHVKKLPPEPKCGILELIPAAIALYLAKPFFDSFLKSLGTDAYAKTKSRLAQTFSNTNSLNLTIAASGAKKIGKGTSYSRIFSIHSNTLDGRAIKFLMPDKPTEEQSEEIIGSLIDQMAAYYETSEDSEILNIILDSESRGNVYLSYSFESKSWFEVTTMDLLGH
ncbi:MAG: hypothetical protein P1V20_30935 [Verrucomicrobiales bacterium]|nr:hypothetical protein [Verrucomicrobiales bacterium]